MSDPTPTPDETPPHAKCGAKTRSGGTCTQRPLKGQKRCRMHGGASPQALQAAANRQARAEAIAAVTLWGGKRDIHPAEALLELVQTKAAEVAYWRLRVTEVTEDELTFGVTTVKTGVEAGTTREAKPNIALVMLHKAEADLAAYAAASLKAGVDEARVRIAEQHAQWAIQLVRRAFEVAGVEQARADEVLVQVTREAINP